MKSSLPRGAEFKDEDDASKVNPPSTNDSAALGSIPHTPVQVQVPSGALQAFEALAGITQLSTRSAYCANCDKTVDVEPTETQCPNCGHTLRQTQDRGTADPAVLHERMACAQIARELARRRRVAGDEAGWGTANQIVKFIEEGWS
jgi:predicted RNA-binding Zn-ribbon protein involved in translation (DUF1610 family)